MRETCYSDYRFNKILIDLKETLGIDSLSGLAYFVEN